MEWWNQKEMHTKESTVRSRAGLRLDQCCKSRWHWKDGSLWQLELWISELLLLVHGAREGSLYHVRCARSQEDMSMKNKERLWHHRFGHQSMKRLVVKKELWWNSTQVNNAQDSWTDWSNWATLLHIGGSNAPGFQRTSQVSPRRSVWSLTLVVEGIMPHEVWYRRKPHVEDLRVFHIPKNERETGLK